MSFWGWFSENWHVLVEAASAVTVAAFTGMLFWLERRRDVARLEVTYFAQVSHQYDLFVVNRASAPVSIEAVTVTLLETSEGVVHRDMHFQRVDGGDTRPVEGGELVRYKLGFRQGTPERTVMHRARVVVKPVFGKPAVAECKGDATKAYLGG